MAASAARFDLPIAASSLGVLVERSPRPDTSAGATWTLEALSDLLVLLGSGPAQIPVLETLDRSGLWERLFPEWRKVRDLPARDRSHVYTVDRHLVQTAVEASALTTSVARADLLLLAALLHDIGKGTPGDHSETGAEIVGPVGRRLGLPPEDVDTLVTVVRHHLLLAALASRRDPEAPETVEEILTVLGGDVQALDILTVLTVADSIATGPTVWTPGRAASHSALVEHCRRRVGAPASVTPPVVEATRPHGRPDVLVELVPRGRGTTHEVTLVVPGGGRSLAVTAEVLAAHRLEVVDADIDLRPPGGMRARLVVTTRFGDPVDPRILRQDLRRAVDSGVSSALRTALERSEAQPWSAPQARSSVLVSSRTDADGVLMEVRAEDRPGLFARVVTAILGTGARIDWVVVRTRGAAVEDIFALSGPGAVLGTAAEVEALLPGHGPDTRTGRAGDTL